MEIDFQKTIDELEKIKKNMSLSILKLEKTPLEFFELSENEAALLKTEDYSYESGMKTILNKGPEIKIVIEDFLNEVETKSENRLSHIYMNSTKTLKEEVERNEFKQFSDILILEKYIDENIKQIEALKILIEIAKVSNTVVLVGGNGSGKSTYISNLKKSSLPNLYIIPAQKYLYFDLGAINRNRTSIPEYCKTVINTNYIDKGKSASNYTSHLQSTFTYPFTYLITALAKDFSTFAVNKEQGRKNDKDEPYFYQMKRIWEQLIPKIELHINADDRSFYISKDEREYSLNEMSDGEKCILFYIGNTLIAPKESYIVIDEPETFLNPNIYNKLWDLLISERSDCQFIFTSHTMDFISSRVNTTFIWCEEFIYPSHFKLKILNDNEDFPIALLTELVGSRKPILFCEGKVNSIDYQVFSKLFINEFTVKPVDGHDEVIRLTKSFNQISGIHGNLAFGIIDRDFLSEEEIKRYWESKIKVLDYNEIEMILLDKTIIHEAIKSDGYDELTVSQKITDFKDKLHQKLLSNKDRMINEATKKKLDLIIQSSVIGNITSSDSVAEELGKLVENIDQKNIYESITSQVDESLAKNAYSEDLKICNLKGEITGALGNTIRNNYKDYAIRLISLNSDIQSTLRAKYFSDLLDGVKS